ncbi:hypothetical protein ABZ299_17160 [Streptomyces sp. NPDC006184]|uniref:hypothetical protein n=1 Tax=Streptomyces sp. NPDC006184 TaxID=3155455 RepID=UPI0033B989F5
MHITIAWWDRSDIEKPKEAAEVCLGDYPGLLAGNPISDTERGREGLALVWETAADADVFMADLALSVNGCPPSHRWDFGVSASAQQAAHAPSRLALLIS